jgi:hypothetical protein
MTRSRWLALSRLPPFADFADDDDAPPFAPFVPLGGDHLAAGRVAVLVVLRVPTDDPPPDGRCAPLRLFRFIAMRQSPPPAFPQIAPRILAAYTAHASVFGGARASPWAARWYRWYIEEAMRP